MSRSYKATGINLKAMPIGENDRLLTILTPEFGLVRAVAPGARKPQSRLGGRSGLFVINQLLIAKGKRLDKLVQAETLRSFPKLSQHLGRLTASQYLAELALFQGLSEQSQEELYLLLVEHLERIENSSSATLLSCLVHGVYHLLVLAGVGPQVRRCCITQEPLVPDLADNTWQVGFSPVAGGAFCLDAALPPIPRQHMMRLGALELALLQQLSQPRLINTALPKGVDAVSAPALKTHELWSRLERVLRQYAQYHFDRPIRSAALIEVCAIPG